ncbi:LysM peptidoglycan-binding domain-containing protein [Lichenihabitans sp. Uapishka_5]|uniref:LysM peptidoglycan-binding domain-containing protein n=1 Tax=Lichenihabitans sp. Uapishka_5 TaxID=3037302 RepID=UPI0029E810AB|nr:LysM peptidoglycan-binding domain-containing protein [Lichenihabitans sp. Uapishka_5]MDX7951966.1 LysM peptidoglycan-binding domain-containing protein [Lichenihabitans sp. Uapishka_5]
MLSFMSDRRVLAVSAAFITAAIFLFLLGTFPSWKSATGDRWTWPSMMPHASTPASAPAVGSMPAPIQKSEGPDRTKVALADTQAASPSISLSGSPAPGSTADASAKADHPAGTPSFDIVRVEPNGDSVIAARAKAGATVVLLDQGRPIAEAKADDSGQVAFVPPGLAPGDHSLMLSLGEPGSADALSSQSVAVSVPERAKAAPLVAMLQPGRPTQLLSAAPAAAVPPVSVSTVDVEEMGGVFATGHATPGSQCRIYLNGSFVANATAGPEGQWSLKIQHGMRPGHYTVRVDELASAAGDVRARAEVPFDYPARATSTVSLLRPRKGHAALPVPPTGPAVTTSPAPAPVQTASALPQGAPAAGPDAAVPASTGAGETLALAPAAVPSSGTAPTGTPAVVAQLLTSKVSHGDSLWRISRKMLGHGRRYTQIYAANTAQIRDPRLIYPGQIFVMPQANP